MARKKRNKILDAILIERIWHGGVGIWALEDKKIVLVKWNVVPWCTVKCLITRQKRDYVEARVLDIVDKWDQEFIAPKCPHYKNIFDGNISEDKEHIIGCGGCKWQVLSYENQLKLKMKLVLDSFRHQTNILQNTDFRDILWSSKDYQYRNKIEFSFGKYIKKVKKDMEELEQIEKKEEQKFSIQKDFQVWFHKQWMFSKVIDVDQCFLVSEKVDGLYKHIKELCFRSWLPVHDQVSHKWFFRHLVVREWFNTNQILINFVVAADYLDNQQKNELWTNLKQKFSKDNFLTSQVKTFCITENNGLADVVKWQDINISNLWWDGFIYEELHFVKDGQEEVKGKKKGKNIEAIVEDWQIKITKKESDNIESKNTKKDVFSTVKVSFRVSPFSFFQTNTNGAELLFKTAFDLIWQVRWTIFDLYCGAGTIWLSLLKQWKWDFVVGVEIVKEAIIDAKYNSKINWLEDKTYFVDWKSEDLVYSDLILQEKVKDLWLVIVDPPRDGLHKNVVSFLNTLKKQHQTKLLYISCNPVTMARDLWLLAEWWWKVDILQAVDMFPQTHHVEMIGILR